MVRKMKPESTWTSEMEKMFNNTTVAKLEVELRAKGSKVSGRKKELVLRLFEVAPIYTFSLD
jgi:hypothetical protein